MSDNETLVIGHRNPDTDAICSAIGYAEFKRRTGLPHAEPVRCGELNERIEFVLKTFGVPAPRLVLDVSPRVRDVMEARVVVATADATLAETLALMDQHNVRIVPVIRADGTCQGFASMTKMIRRLCPPAGQSAEFGEVTVSMRNLARALGATTPAVFNPGPEERLTLTLATMSPGAFAKRLEAGSPRAHLVLAGDNPAIQELAIRAGVRALVLTHGAGADDALLEEARRHEVSVLLTAHNTAASAMLCHAAASIGHMVHEQFLPFHEDDLLAEVRAQATDSPFRAFPVLDAENRTVGILSKSDFLKKVRRQLILVDHNEFSQAVPGADQVEILEVIDHHRLSVHSAVPILVHNEPVGSTSTIVADFFFRSPVEMPRAVAGLLMAGLVSDTLNLSSPTTTDKDRVILGRLEQLAQTKASEFIEKLFASGSVLVSRPAEQAVTADCKEFTHKGRTFSAAQIEELGFDPFWKRKDEVFAALEAYRRQKRYDFSALLVTDVTRQTSILLMTGSAAVAKQISHPRLEAGLYEMPGMVSRKKQLLPYLLECVDKAGPPPATAA